MQKHGRGGWVLVGVIMAIFGCAQLLPNFAAATTSRSENFEASETEFGTGSALNTCSGSYCAQATIGSLTEGDSESPAFTASFSTPTEDSEPSLEVMIEPGQSFLGVMSVDSTVYRTMKLHVRSYLAGGYQVQITGTPPRYENYTLQAPSAAIASTPGSEQFALNVVKNTTPSVGEDIEFSFSEEEQEDVIMPPYRTPDLFAYRSGDVIARTVSESSQARFTISMIVNVAGSTPAGHYSGDFSAIVTPVF